MYIDNHREFTVCQDDQACIVCSVYQIWTQKRASESRTIGVGTTEAYILAYWLALRSLCNRFGDATLLSLIMHMRRDFPHPRRLRRSYVRRSYVWRYSRVDFPLRRVWSSLAPFHLSKIRVDEQLIEISMHFLVLAIAILLSGIVFFACHEKKRARFAKHFEEWSRKSRIFFPSAASKKQRNHEKNASPVDYVHVFPPQQRQALARVAETLPQLHEVFTRHGLNVELSAASVTPLEANYLDCEETIFTPTGISLEEVKLLGDFPNYAELSGIPNPQPYENFDIENALSRPYRPFRWAYHQTMCMTACIR